MTVPIRSGQEIPAAALVPEPWQALSLQNGWVARGGFYTPSYRRAPGGRVELTGGMIDGDTTDGALIAILPSGYRPASESPIEMMTNAGQSVGLIIRPTGDMEINSSSATVSYTSLHLHGFFLLEV